ncbi:MAG: succinylglutamate desuccinylase, partial [Lachnospiraceae bacterium]|nr:succinylglutamate desuccinylase [Lachnospiraceae bacterium]
ILETLYAPSNRVAFFVHNEPLTYANTAVIKLIEKY